MVLSQEIIDYLQKTNIPTSINQNFLLTDLEKVIYAATYNDNKYYLEKNLDNSLNKIISQWQNKTFCEDLYIIENTTTVPIIQNDRKNYSAQIILPIIVNKDLVGLAIFFRTQGNYISSSLKMPKTIRDFIQILLIKG